MPGRRSVGATDKSTPASGEDNTASTANRRAKDEPPKQDSSTESMEEEIVEQIPPAKESDSKSAEEESDAARGSASPVTPATPTRRRGRPPKTAASKSATQSAGRGPPRARTSSQGADSADGRSAEANPGKAAKATKRKLQEADNSKSEESSLEPPAKTKAGAAEELTSPRRSGRGPKPNRKYADMEVELVKKRSPRAAPGGEGQRKTGPRTPKVTAEAKDESVPPAKPSARLQSPLPAKATESAREVSEEQTPVAMDVDEATETADEAAAAVTVVTAPPTATVATIAAAGATPVASAVTAATSASVATETSQPEAMEVEESKGAVTGSQTTVQELPPLSAPLSVSPSASAAQQPPSLAPPASASLPVVSKTQATGTNTADADDLSELGTIAADAGIQVVDTSATTEGALVTASSQTAEVTQISYEALLKQLGTTEPSTKSATQTQLLGRKVIVVHPPKGAVITNKGARALSTNLGTTNTSGSGSSLSGGKGTSAAPGTIMQLPATAGAAFSMAAELQSAVSSGATATVTSATASELTFSGADLSQVCPPMSPAIVTPVTLTSNPDLETSTSQLTSLEVMTPGTSKMTMVSPLKVAVSEAASLAEKKGEGQMTVRKVLLEDMDEDLATAVQALNQHEKSQAEGESTEEGCHSKYSTASTQTPIEAGSREGTTLSSGSVMKTVSVSMPGEPGHTGGQGRQEIILVTLPEGAAIKQAVVRRREMVDHSDPNFQALEIDGCYHCNACPYNTSKKANWYKHKRKHMGLRPHQCPHCSYSAATSSNLRRHIAIHEDVRSHQCHICNLMFRQKIHLERHIKYKHEEKSVQCPQCDYVCANLNPDLKIHMRRKHMPPDQAGLHTKAFNCPECSTLFASKRDLRQHLKFHRKGPELKLYCEQCSFVTDCESRLRRHMCIHTKEKPFKCGLCDYRGSQKEHVLRHMKSQHNIDIVRKHKRVTDGLNARDGMSTLERDFSSQAKIFACNHCTMKFSKLINLYKHLYTQHKSIMPPPKNDEFNCVVCDFHTSTKKNLLVHMRKHNVNDQNPPSHVYSCVLCSYMNPKRRNLFQHMKKKHHIEIVMKDDGSASAYVTDNTNIREESDQHLLTVGDQVIATTSREVLVSEESNSCPILHMDDLAMIISNPQAGSDTLMIEGQPALAAPATITTLDQHEAAEAIVGLTALAGQGIAEGVIEEQVQIMATDDQGTITVVEPGVEEGVEVGEAASTTQEAQDQLQILSSGDYVEIDGEVYKVEISNEENVVEGTGVVLNTSPAQEGTAEDDLPVGPLEPNLSVVKEEKE